MTLQELAKELEPRTKEALESLATELMGFDAIRPDGRNISFYLDYDEQDMLNAATIMYSVCSNYAIKHKILTESNANIKIACFREMLKETFGLDTVQEAYVGALMDEIKRIGGLA